MENFQSPKFWKMIKKNRKSKNSELLPYIIAAVIIGLTAFWGIAELYIIAIIAFLPAPLCFLLFYVKEKRTMRIICNLPPLEASLIASELESEQTVCYEENDLYLTEHYIVVLSTTFKIIKYSDIVWMYNIDTNAAAQGGRQLIVFTKDNRTRTILVTPFENNQKINSEVMDFISGKNSIILKGYSPENIEIMNRTKESNKKPQ
ncbi:MAG: hypothetical protein LBS21_04865 [Clostridiales bacterium]|jgi:hypothetical protein|nr:hypothetical protein [Clostridiales bacterium]